MRDIHVVYSDFTHLGQGWDLFSPQIPSLVGGDHSLKRLIRETPEILALAGVSGDYNLIQHEQKYAESPDGLGFFLRFLGLEDPHEDDRAAVIGRQLYAVETGGVEDELDRMPTLPTGERLIIAVHPDDSLGWVLDQLCDAEGCLATWYGGSDALYSIPIFDGEREFGRGWMLERLGLDRESPLREVFDAVLSSEAAGLVKVDASAAQTSSSDVRGLAHYA